MTATWKYLLLGIVTTALSFGVLLAWGALGGWQGGAAPNSGWMMAGRWLIGGLLWLVGLLLVVLRLRGRPWIRLGAYAVGAFLPSAAFALWVMGESTVSSWWHRERFDPVVWRAPADTAEVFWPTRLRMVDDLLARGLLRGLTRDSVRALLGPADRERDAPAASFRYYLGPERDWIRIDSEELVIRFGADGRVIEARTARD